jgi:nucleoside-diphosphate-sugar epimerase
VHGDGTSLWTLTHSRDFAKGFGGLLANPWAYGEAFHITSDEAPSWNAIMHMLAAAAGVDDLKIVHVPSDAIAAVDKGWGDALLGDMGHSIYFDNSKLKNLVPEFICTTPFAQGAREVVQWFDANPDHKVVDAAKDETMDWLAQTYAPRGR